MDGDVVDRSEPGERRVRTPAPKRPRAGTGFDLDQGDVADGAPVEQPLDFDKRRVMARLEMRPELQPRRLEGLDHAPRVRHGQRQRLFTEHVPAGARRREGLFGVLRVRRRDVDDVDLGVPQQLRVPGVRPLGAVLLRERLGAPPVTADRRDQRPLAAERLDRRRRRAAGEAAGPDDSPSQ